MNNIMILFEFFVDVIVCAGLLVIILYGLSWAFALVVMAAAWVFASIGQCAWRLGKR